jgi:hypothetical protein
MSAIIIEQPRWIISRRDDLLFFIGSALFGYALIAWASVRPGLPSMFLVLFAFLLDGPHVFSTLTRSLFDGAERSRLKKAWLIGFPLCLVVIAVLAMTAGNVGAFVVIAAVSQYHVSKQHMGFVMIYKRKAGERSDYKLDRYFTLGSLMLPLALYFSALFHWGIPLTWFLAIAVLAAIYYAWHQVRKPAVNVPKLLLLVAFIPLQWFAWHFRAAQPLNLPRLVAAGVALNAGHSLQYLRLMYFHNHNRYSDRPGLLGVVSRKPIFFLAAAVTLALPSFFSAKLQGFYLPVFVVGMLFFHFIVDSRIWRVRGDHELAAALRL